LLDNMDGITAGTVILALIALALVGAALNPGAPMNAFAALGAGAAAGFLAFNFSPARIYMGDSGSLSLGTMVAVSALSRGNAGSIGGFDVMLLSALVCWVPIFDTTLVTVARLREGRPVSLGGRDHTAHRLHGLGWSERKIALALYIVTILTGFFAYTVWTGLVRGFYPVLAAWLAASFTLGYFFLKPKLSSNVK
ncbi:MAG: hypothetical protein HUU37_11335, partial [Bdellovibrionales bacterium]|nr:hypothetical protein [Bdellovibrionales bacterium]